MKSYTTNRYKKYTTSPRDRKIIWYIIGVVSFLLILMLFIINIKKSDDGIIVDEIPPSIHVESIEQIPVTLYTVTSVTDGDTIRINYNGTETPVRLIGVNTPETVDPRTTVECFGKEASDFLKSLLGGKSVSIEADPTQSDRDKYDRLLRYVYLDGEDVGHKIISSGYGYEYTYNIPYQKQSEYKTAQSEASSAGKGLWSPSTCSGQKTPAPQPTPSPTSTANCKIKGNINSKGEKIYHMPGQKYYDATKIDTSKGERYFCTEQEAVNAGWRKSKV